METSGPRTQFGWRRWSCHTLCWSRNIGWRRAGVTRKPQSSIARAGVAVSRPAKRNALKAKTDSSPATSAGTFVAAPKSFRGWNGSGQRAAGRAKSSSTERNQQMLEATSRERFGDAQGSGFWRVTSTRSPTTFGQYATPARLPGVLVKPAAPTFRHGASVRCFDYFVVHRAVACQIREVRVLEESGVCFHHPIQFQAKTGHKGTSFPEQPCHRPSPRLVVRENLTAGTVDFSRRAWMNDGTQLMLCTEREILGGRDILGDEARAYMGQEALLGGSSGKLRPQSRHNRPRIARDTRWWRVLSNRLRELWLMEFLPTRRPYLPRQPEQIERLRTHLRRMANEARAEEDHVEIWEMATQTYGEPELQVLKDVHWKALTVLDKLHKRDRAGEKSIAEYAREASEGAAGLLHRLTKPRPVWCPRDAAQGEATNPRDVFGTGSQGTGHAFGGCTWKSCRRRTGRGRLQTERTCLFCLSSKSMVHLASMQR